MTVFLQRGKFERTVLSRVGKDWKPFTSMKCPARKACCCNMSTWQSCRRSTRRQCFPAARVLLSGSLFSKVEQSLPQQNLVPGLGSAFPPWALTRVWCVTVCSFNGGGVNNESCVCWSNADVGRAVVPNHAWFLTPFWHRNFFFLGWKLMD